MGEQGTRVAIVAWLVVFTGLASAIAYGETAVMDDLGELSLEELMSIEVTSVSKKEESIRDAATAIFVITQEDIRRSGATSIPELLRLVPGMQVGRLNSRFWGISARGFNNTFSNKLLVLIDGRSVYTPLFAGTYWDVQHTLLEDIERIEVIRGPGGALWGANAVNGVINIITKDAADTQGGLLRLGAGTEEKLMAGFRYGDRLGDAGFWRFYALFNDWDGGEVGGDDVSGEWSVSQMGARFDWAVGDEDGFTLSTDWYEADYNTLYVNTTLWPPYSKEDVSDGDTWGGNILGRWTHTFSDESDFQLQAYADVTNRFEKQPSPFEEPFRELRHTFDLDFQHRFPAGTRHDIVWGLGYRYTQDSIDNNFGTALRPDEDESSLYNAFIQDQISFLEDELTLTLGSKFEYNDYSDFEVQPSVRLAWTPDDRHTLWGAISRAVRTPSRAEFDVQINSIVIPPGIVLANVGDVFDSEKVTTAEAGYRVLITEEVSADIAVFYSLYDDLRTVEIDWPFIALGPHWPHLVVPAKPHNNAEADTYGLELVLDWRPVDWWQFRATYTFLEVDLDLSDVKTLDLVTGDEEGSSPQHQIRLDSRFNLPRNVELDVMLQYVDSLDTFGVDDYVDMDVRLGWQPRENLALELVGQNLLDSSRLEFAPSFVNFIPTRNERGVYGKITWRF